MAVKHFAAFTRPFGGGLVMVSACHVRYVMPVYDRDHGDDGPRALIGVSSGEDGDIAVRESMSEVVNKLEDFLNA